MNAPLFRGAMTALITPFDSSGQIQEKHLRDLIDLQVQGRVDAIVPCGTTGEASTLNFEEHCQICKLIVEHVNKRTKVIIGAGSNNTEHAIKLTNFAQKIHADAVLLVGPYYNKPSQKGHYLHFKKIAESVEIPIIIYNIPGRTGVNILPETILRLAEIPNIVGIKEASGNMDQVMAILKDRPSDFSVLSGDDSLTLPFIAVGGDGCISVIANEVPTDFTNMVHKALEGHWKSARELHYRLFELMQLNFLETNPVPVKAALSMMGLIQEVYRLPLVPMATENRQKLESALKKLKLI